LGGLAGASYSLYRLSHNASTVRFWGVLGALDLVLLILLGALVGLAIPAVLGIAGVLARRIPLRALAAIALTGVVVSGGAVGWVLMGSKAAPARARENRDRPPDIVVVIYDAVRADILADKEGRIPDWCPRLRTLADGAVTYRHAVSSAPWTLPSHASLFTGLSELDHGATEECPVLRPGMATIARLLQEQGYHTAAVVANPWLSRQRGFDQGFAEYVELWQERSRPLPLLFRAASRLGWDGWPSALDPREDKGARMGSRMARQIVESADPEKPLFLFVNFVDAHPPYRAPLPERYAFVSEEALQHGIDPDDVPQNWVDLLAGQSQLSAADRDVLRALNQGEVAYLDKYLGEILDTLQETGRLENSFVAVTSDHGSALGEDKRLGSGFDLREEMLRIPMVVRYPDGRGAGTLQDDLVYLHDLFPTMVQVAGVAERYGLNSSGMTASRNGLPLLGGEPRRYGLSSYAKPVNMISNLWASHPQFDTSYLERRLLSLRGERYKLVWSSAGEESLYDLEGRGENEDLAAQLPAVRQEQKEILLKMLGASPEAAWRQMLESARSGLTAKRDLKSDQKALDVLRSLGYVGGDR
jgi:arylsulfatase A-like enzyme